MPAVPAPDSGFKARQEEEAGGQGSVWLRRRPFHISLHSQALAG